MTFSGGLGRAVLELTTDQRGLDQGLKQAEGKSQQHGVNIAGIAGKAAFALGGIALGVAGLSIKAAADAQAISAQTAAVLASTKGVAGVTQTAVEGLALSLSLVTPFEDDLIQKTQNMLLTFTSISKEVFPEVTETALNMAQALGGDPVQQSIALGKALNDPIAGMTALRRVGVQFTDDQEKVVKALVESGDLMGAQKLILAELATEFGGSARAAGTTFAGQLAIARNALGNVTEAIGGPLMGALAGLMTGVTPMLVAFGETIPTVMAALGEVFDVLTGRAPAAGAELKKVLGPGMATTIMQTMATIREVVRAVFGFIAEQVVPRVTAAMTFLRDHWESAAFAMKVVAAFVLVPAFVAWAVAAGAAALATIVALAPVILVVAAVGAAAFLLHEAWTKNLGGIQEKTAAVVGFLGGAFGMMRDVIAAAWGAIGPILSAGLEFILAPIRTVIAVVQGAIGLISRFTNTPVQPPPFRAPPRAERDFPLADFSLPPISSLPLSEQQRFVREAFPENFPTFAHGGVMPWSGLAHLERGETVTPAGATITVPVYLDGQEIARAIARPMARELRLAGLNA